MTCHVGLLYHRHVSFGRDTLFLLLPSLWISPYSAANKLKLRREKLATGKERGDLEIKEYVVLQKSQEQVDRLPPPRTVILDFTESMTHTPYGRSHV